MAKESHRKNKENGNEQNTGKEEEEQRPTVCNGNFRKQFKINFHIDFEFFSDARGKTEKKGGGVACSGGDLKMRNWGLLGTRKGSPKVDCVTTCRLNNALKLHSFVCACV